MKSRARTLTSKALAAESIDRDGLRRVLEHGRFVDGSEREFYGRTMVFNHVTERVLRFGSAAGASSYLRWVLAQAPASLGAPRSVTELDGTKGTFVYRPKGCGCHTDTPTYLMGWRRGTTALTVLASGPGATPATVSALARALERTLP